MIHAPSTCVLIVSGRSSRQLNYGADQKYFRYVVIVDHNDMGQDDAAAIRNIEQHQTQQESGKARRLESIERERERARVNGGTWGKAQEERYKALRLEHDKALQERYKARKKAKQKRETEDKLLRAEKAALRNAEQLRALHERKKIWEETEAYEQAGYLQIKRLLKEAPIWFQQNFIEADQLFREGTFANFNLEATYRSLKLEFLREWFQKDALESSKPTIELDDEQLLAIGSVDGNFQVIARAGSGKTATAVRRAYFLVRHCGIRPNEIMLLAFNKNAALEIRKRLLIMFKPEAEALIIKKRQSIKKAQKGHKKLDFEIDDKAIFEVANTLGVELPFAMTFHALALAIVQPSGSILYDDEDSNALSKSTLVQTLVNEVLNDDAKANSIQQLLMAHFKADWTKIIEGNYPLPPEELLILRRSLPNQSIDGKYLKSFGEKLIADFLFEHSVEYYYERTFFWNNIKYQPDFTVLNGTSSGVIIEYFGLVGDPGYDREIIKKRNYWEKQKNWQLIEIYPPDIARGYKHLSNLLIKHLHDAGVRTIRRTDEEIWSLIKDDSILRYTKVVDGFIERCRQIGLDSTLLSRKIRSHQAISDIESRFLKQAGYLLEMYESALKERGDTDFGEVLSDSAVAISSGNTKFHRTRGNGNLRTLKYLFVDEFQDFSFHFNELLQAILEQNPGLSVFCVGDDWQAINSFAGSNLTYYHNFVDLVPDAKRLLLSTNYRSDANVVEFGNLIMLGTGSPALAKKPGVNVSELCFLDSFVATPSEQEKHGFDEITPATLRIIQSQLESDRDVVILLRTKYVPYSMDKKLSEVKGNGLDKYLMHIRSFFDKELANRITISTTHKYKGREKQCVIILDAKEKRYPLIHPDWVFSRILGSDLLEMVEEERRLFYVAATRAVDKLFIISEEESLTPFIDSHRRQRLCKVLDWQTLRGPDDKTSAIVVRISSVGYVQDSGTYAIRGQLKSCGYRFIPGETKYWQKAYLPEIFSLSKLKLESWAIPRDDLDVDGIQVIVNLAPYGEIGRYKIENGSWICEFEDGSNLKL